MDTNKNNNEIWRECREYPRYEVSNTGRVRNKKGRLMSQWPNDGYMLVRLIDENGVGRNIRVHRLVAIEYIKNPSLLPVVDHINRVRSDNRAVNLRWSSHRANNQNRRTIDDIIKRTLELSRSGVRDNEIRKYI